MNSNPPDDPRRLFLIRALAAGLYGLSGIGRVSAEVLGQIPEKLQKGKSFYRVTGEVQVNGQPATIDTLVTATDKLKTGAGSQAIFVVGQDAFMLRENSELQLGQKALSGKDKFRQRLKQNKAALAQVDKQGQNLPPSDVVESFRLITGGVLSVFGKTSHEVQTSTASIGIRGTGVYLESQSDISYVCTCYGITEITPLNDPHSVVTVDSQYHDAPKYVLAAGSTGQQVITAPFKNHGDLELILLEELVGRTPPFSAEGEYYYGASDQDY